jgi:urate oxidase
LKKYNHRFLVIIGEDVVGDYDNLEQAYFQSEKKHKLGTFLIQECTEGDEAYTVRYNSPCVTFH